MNSELRIELAANAAQRLQLEALQRTFAEMCTALGPIVRAHRCWHRVTLHHLAYRALRQQFPLMGSQMACNAIYSVSRTCRALFQSPASPLFVGAAPERPLPLVKFLSSAPVYFDRHTLNIRNGELSMFSMEGRMNFKCVLTGPELERFFSQKLREIVLLSPLGRYELAFAFSELSEKKKPGVVSYLPEYLLICEEELSAPEKIFG